MKKISILLFTAILFSCGAFAQDYYPLVENNKKWNVLLVEQIGPYPWDTTYSTLSYKFQGDTLIDGKTYKKVYKFDHQSSQDWVLRCFIREDENKRVYTYSYLIEGEILMYDFSANPGDSLLVGGSGYEDFYLHVDSITQIEIDNSMRNKYWLSCHTQQDYNETWIEGIGSDRGILQTNIALMVGGRYWFLCYWQDEELVYSNPDFEGCWMTNVGLEEARERQIRIYPNPAKDYLRVENTGNNRIREISISDITGREIMFIKECNRPINISSLASGVYIVKVIYSGSEITRKLVVE